MGRKKATTHRDQGEYAGYLWRETALLCPKCGAECRALVTPRLAVPRGLECTACPWSQFPGNAPTLSSTPESRHEAEEQRKRELPCKSKTAIKNAVNAPNAPK